MATPIELLYNERYETDGEHEHGPIFDVARVEVEPSRDRLVIQLPQPGHIVLSHEGWMTLVQEVKQRFEEVSNERPV